MSDLYYTLKKMWQGCSRRSLKNYVVVCASLILLLTLASCKSEKLSDVRNTFVYNEANGLQSLDPALAGYQSATWVGSQIFNSLVEYDSAMNIVPCLAKSWSVNSSGTEWTFIINTKVSFHEHSCFGKKQYRNLRANDVEYSFKRILHSSTKSTGTWVFRKTVLGAEDYIAESKNKGIANSSCKGFRVVNDSTFCISLVKPFAPFLAVLTTPYCWIVPHEAVDMYGDDFGANPVGTGPFVFADWVPDIRLRLVKNYGYFKKDENGTQLPYLDAVNVSFIKDTKTEFLEFKRGNLDFISSIDPSFSSSVVEPSGKLKPEFQSFILMQQPALAIEYYGILMDTSYQIARESKLTANRFIRQALNYAIDREKIVRYVLNGKGFPAVHGVLPPSCPGFTGIKGYMYDVQLARNLLAKAGFPNGKNLPHLVLQIGNNQRSASVAESVQEQWKEIGVNVSIRQVEFPKHLSMIRACELPLWRTSWLGDYPDPENFLSLFYSGVCSPKGPNTTHFTHREVDSLYESALSPLLSSGERYSKYRRIEEIVVEESPWIFLYYNKIQRLVQPKIVGLPLDGSDRLVLERVRKVYN